MPSTPSADASTLEQQYRDYVAQNPQRGVLRAQTMTARNTYPVPDVTVSIYKVFDNGDHLIASQQTDSAGRTAGVLLPAPDRELSETPGESARPFATYKVTFSHPDFATIIALQVPVFSGETSMQSISMIPIAVNPDGTAPIHYITTEPSDL